MESAAGLGALGFWLFLAAIVVAGIWFDARKRESQQETLRRVVESGQNIDVAVLEQLVKTSGDSSRIDRDLKVSGLIMVFIAPGLAFLGWFLSFIDEKAFIALLGVAVLVLFIGAGLLAAAAMARRWQEDDRA
jgi:hypothetical protein